MVHYGDETVLELSHQLREGSRFIGAHSQHQTDVRIAEGHLRAGLADRCHGSSPKSAGREPGPSRCIKPRP